MNRNEVVQGPGSERLTAGAPICGRCNNALTQPYDLAWDAVRNYLLSNWPSIRVVRQFDLQAVFPERVEAHAIDVQLYFAKVLGCLVVERHIAADINAFIKALLQRRAHPLLRLIFADCSNLHSKSLAYVSDMHISRDERSSVQTIQIGYVLRPLSVQMIYTAQASSLRPIPGAWHPLSGHSIVRLGPEIGKD
jgi:hypothetical protein